MGPLIVLFYGLLLSVNALSQSNKYKDSRDNEIYGTKTLGNLVWMTENIRHQQKGRVCYNNDSKMCARLGGLYTFESALKACPAGWRLATDSDWKDLEVALSMPKSELNYNDYNRKRGSSVGPRLKSGGNSGLELKISGYAFLNKGNWTFDGVTGDRTRSYFWTSTSENSDGIQVYRRRIEQNNDSIYRFWNPPQNYANSVRCVQNKI